MKEPDNQWNTIVAGLLTGDDRVCQEFWNTYGARLSRLAEQRLPESLQRRVEPEDIVQSACRTFFRRAQNRELDITDRDMLWPLLCVITINKVRRQIRFHSRERRDARREASTSDTGDERPVGDPFTASGGTSPADAAIFAEQMEGILAKLSEKECKVVELKLAECTQQEIADQLLCSVRTVRRMIAGIRKKLHAAFEGT